MRKLCVILAFFSFCTIAVASKKYPLTANSVVPAAKGQVVTDKDKNGNVRLKIEVEHLANPQSLTPPAAAYVVWIQDKDGIAANQGQMKVNKNLDASFETITSSRSFELFVTGERDYNAKSPVGPEVFRITIQP